MSDAVVIEKDRLQDLLDTLSSRGCQTIGPMVERDAIVYGPVSRVSDLPEGYIDEQEGGHYRLRKTADKTLFRYVVGPHSWKRFLFPPQQRLWRAKKTALDSPSKLAATRVRSRFDA